MFKHAQLESVKAWLGDPAHGALPLHARVQRAIRQLILDGALDVGRPLPASRALAKSLGVSRDTVESAYGQLQTEATATPPQFYQLDGNGARSVLTPADNQSAIPRAAFTTAAEQILIESQQQLFYALSEAGFAKTPPTKAVAQQLEVVRDYLDAEGKVVSTAKQGDELTVRLRLRSLTDGWHSNVAVVDLLPAGFAVVRSSVPRQQGRWRADYVDIREDRIVYYAGFGPQLTELKYQVKATAAGDFTLPTVTAESMYDRTVYASTAAGRFVVSAAK